MTRDELTARHALYYDTCYLDVIFASTPKESSQPHKDLNYRTQAPTDHFAPPRPSGFVSRIRRSPSQGIVRKRPACHLHGPVTRETQRHPNGAKMAKEKGEKRKAKGGGDAGGESKRAKKKARGKKNVEPPAKPKDKAVDVTQAFVHGGDIKELGKGADNPFTADALAARYKEEGKTVNVDKGFNFANLVTDAKGASFSLLGGAGDTAPAPSAFGEPTGGGSVAKRRRDDPDEKNFEPVEPAEPEEPEEELTEEEREALIRKWAEEGAKKAEEFQKGKTAEELYWLIMGITPEVVEEAKAFVRPFDTEEEMIRDWEEKREGWREDFKRRHRDAMRRQKRNRQGGDKFHL